MPEPPFHATTTDYDLGNALFLAKASQLAYADEAEVKGAMNSFGLTKCLCYSIGDTQAFLAADDKRTIVAFRGTEPEQWNDWLTDGDSILERGSDSLGGRVHAGFSRALDLIWNGLSSNLKTLQNGTRSLWLTGHSLGGALAAVAAARLADAGRPFNGAYTFGQPRVGDTTFSRNFDADCDGRLHRFVNNNDIVPRLPPRGMGYRDTGRCLYLDSKGKIQTDEHTINMVIDSVQGVGESIESRLADLKLWAPPDAIEDHFIANYVAAIQKNLPKASK